MRLRIFRVRIMDIIGHNKLDPCLLRKLDLSLVYKLLLRDPVILHLQKEISFAENILILQRHLLRLFGKSPAQISLYLPRKTGT